MPVQREKVVRAAEKLVSRGKIDAAIREYRKVLEDQPDDATTLNRVGDLYARSDRIDEAIKLFSQIAEGYTADGFFVKAIAIFKKIIKLDPTRLEVYERLAGLYHRQGLLNEARTQYQVLADYYQKHDDAAAAIGIYERMALIDPEDPAPRVKLAELYCEQKLLDRAMGEYRHIAELMLGHGRVEQAEQVYRRALEVTADDLEFVTDAVLELRKSGHLPAAARLLAFAVELNPAAAEVARTAHLRGGGGGAGGAAEVAEGPPAQADEADLAEAVEESPAVEPEGGSQLAGVAGAEAGEAVVAPAAVHVEAPPDLAAADLVLDLDEPLELDDSIDLGSGFDLAEEIGRAGEEIEAGRARDAAAGTTGELEIDLDLELDEEPVAPSRPSSSQARSGEVEIDAAFLERTAAELIPESIQQEDDLITEAEVLAKYGLSDKASERLAELLDLNPRHPGGLRLRVQLLVEADRFEEAVSEAASLRDVVGEGSAVWSDTVERLEKAGYSVAEGRIEPPQEAPQEPPQEAPQEPPQEAPAAEEPSVDTLAAAVPAPTPPAAEEPSPRPGRVRRMEREVESLLDEIADALVPGRRKRKQAADAAAPAAPAPVQETPAAPSPGDSAPPEAASPPLDGADAVGGSEWIEAVGSHTAAAGAAGDGIFDQEEDFFDLAAEIEEELAREGALEDDELLLEAPREQSLEEIVEGFKQGVSEALSPTDYATHLDLGIAYREMGLLDEAIGEFQIAAKDPAQLVQCCSMLGLSFVDKGLPELAVKWYRRGLAVPDLSEDDQLGLLYDLGNAHLAMEEREAAYHTFVDLYGTNSNYRDVVAKLAETEPRR